MGGEQGDDSRTAEARSCRGPDGSSALAGLAIGICVRANRVHKAKTYMDAEAVAPAEYRMSSPLDAMLTLDEAAKYLHISRRSFVRHVQPSVAVVRLTPRKVRVTRDELDRWVASRVQAATPGPQRRDGEGGAPQSPQAKPRRLRAPRL
jgi:excisionase family DNA binding protein